MCNRHHHKVSLLGFFFKGTHPILYTGPVEYIKQADRSWLHDPNQARCAVAYTAFSRSHDPCLCWLSRSCTTKGPPVINTRRAAHSLWPSCSQRPAPIELLTEGFPECSSSTGCVIRGGGSRLEGKPNVCM